MPRTDEKRFLNLATNMLAKQDVPNQYLETVRMERPFKRLTNYTTALVPYYLEQNDVLLFGVYNSDDCFPLENSMIYLHLNGNYQLVYFVANRNGYSLFVEVDLHQAKHEPLFLAGPFNYRVPTVLDIDFHLEHIPGVFFIELEKLCYAIFDVVLWDSAGINLWLIAQERLIRPRRNNLLAVFE